MPTPVTESQPATPLEHALREARRGLAVVGGLSLFLNLLVLVSPLYMFQVFDRVLPSGHVETLVALTLAAGFALLVLGLLEAIRSLALVRIGAWLDRDAGRAGARGQPRPSRWPGARSARRRCAISRSCAASSAARPSFRSSMPPGRRCSWP